MTKRFSFQKRASGILLHPTSLPSPHGVGDLGPWARRMVEFLQASGQTWWQMLPIGPTGFGNSPYNSLSAFAGSPLLISLEELAHKGLLSKKELTPASDLSASRVKFNQVKLYKESRLRWAYAKFCESAGQKEWDALKQFSDLQHYWLDDFTLYCALKITHHNKAWTEWSPPLRQRDPKSLAEAKEKMRDEIQYHKFVQYVFHDQWKALKGFCHRSGVGLMGDVPIFVAHDSSDVWAHRDIFYLNEDGKPSVVAGISPDYFSRTGQLWGNPLYRWDVLKRHHYDWWVDRFKRAMELFDGIRLDHFIGFHRFWEIPASDSTAVNGRWVKGPGAEFFKEVLSRVGFIEIIAEDLGLLTPEVKKLRDQFKFSGMKVLQFAFGDLSLKNEYLPHHYQKNCVVYTGTHDNDTSKGWYDSLPVKRESQFVLRYLKSDGCEIHWDMIRAAYRSVANLAIVPLQDVLGLGSKDRMNTPGHNNGNWEWRLKANHLTKNKAQTLFNLSRHYGRIQ